MKHSVEIEFQKEVYTFFIDLDEKEVIHSISYRGDLSAHQKNYFDDLTDYIVGKELSVVNQLSEAYFKESELAYFVLDALKLFYLDYTNSFISLEEQTSILCPCYGISEQDLAQNNLKTLTQIQKHYTMLPQCKDCYGDLEAALYNISHNKIKRVYLGKTPVEWIKEVSGFISDKLPLAKVNVMEFKQGKIFVEIVDLSTKDQEKLVHSFPDLSFQFSWQA